MYALPPYLSPSIFGCANDDGAGQGHRCLVENTIEECILRLQDVKTGAYLSHFLSYIYIHGQMDWYAYCRIG